MPVLFLLMCHLACHTILGRLLKDCLFLAVVLHSGYNKIVVEAPHLYPFFTYLIIKPSPTPCFFFLMNSFKATCESKFWLI